MRALTPCPVYKCRSCPAGYKYAVGIDGCRTCRCGNEHRLIIILCISCPYSADLSNKAFSEFATLCRSIEEIACAIPGFSLTLSVSTYTNF